MSLFAMCGTTLAVVTKLGTLPLSATARVAPRPSPYRGSPMTGRTEHGTEGSINSAGLAALLDKLVAVDLGLSPICRWSEEGPLVAAGDAIADACDILRSAIADLRNIIHQIDGLTYLLPAGRPLEKPSSSASRSCALKQAGPGRSDT